MKQPTGYRPGTKRNRYYSSPYKDFGLLAVFLTLALAGGLIFLKLPLYVAYMAGLNAITLGFYAYDKLQAKKAGRRIPELVLHYMALFGGAPGALIGQWLFHHKTRKPIFHIVVWSSLLLHLVVFGFFFQILLTYTDWYAAIRLLERFYTQQTKSR